MHALTRQLAISLRLHFRNRMALLYSYLFPTIFLIAFWTLYRYDQVPLIRHVGELLTISVLGGACFGLPTTMVSERERGVWRRYRLTPASTGSLVASTVAARYVLLLIAGLLQIALAMGLGMPFPRHPVELFIAFTCVAFAFLGVGLVIAMLADNVPAVQALGQCIFLPMLIVGGVAVPLQSLPPWAERLSAYLPGRYAVQAMQSCANGDGLTTSAFSIVALLVIGAAGSIAGARLFRWDQEQRFATQPGKAWVAVAFATWAGVGVASGFLRPITPPPSAIATASTVMPSAPNSPSAPVPEPTAAPSGQPPASSSVTPPVAPAGSGAKPVPSQPQAETTATTSKADVTTPSRGTAASSRAVEPAATDRPTATFPKPPIPPVATPPSTWQAVTTVDIDRDLTFDRLPPDTGVVTPIAADDQMPDQDLTDQLAGLADALVTWSPGYASDTVQRTRNLLYVIAVPDVAQTAVEPFVPAIVYQQIQANTPRTDLIKVLYWIALFPEQGTIPPPAEFVGLGFQIVPNDAEELRNRAAIYAVKLLGRLTGHIK